MSGPARSPIRQSLLRPQLVLGGERTLVLSSGMIAAVLIFSLGSVTIGAIGVAFWLVSLAVFQRMAKHDPELSRVYVRHVNKRIYYVAHPHISAPDPEIKRNQKG
ncbi:MAG: conjugal transfer protein TrbD [Vulcanimicrobiaceae bacterium]